jgi:hypothetical protein
MSDPALRERIRSSTACYLDLHVTPVPSPAGKEYLVRFLADQQGCLSWYLHPTEDGTGHTVVCTGDLFGHDQDQPAHAGDIKLCAESFEAFVGRHRPENEIFFAETDEHEDNRADNDEADDEAAADEADNDGTADDETDNDKATDDKADNDGTADDETDNDKATDDRATTTGPRTAGPVATRPRATKPSTATARCRRSPPGTSSAVADDRPRARSARKADRPQPPPLRSRRRCGRCRSRPGPAPRIG